MNDSDLQKELEKFKAEQIKGIEEDWSDFYDRYDSIIYDILEIGRVVDLEESVGAVKGLDVGRVLRVAGEVFDAGKAFVLRG